MDETHAGPPAELRIRSVDSDREPAVPSQPCVSDEELEQEPRLTYGRFGADVPNILATEAACRLCVSDKVLALGTKDGAVHLLDYDGNKVRACNLGELILIGFLALVNLGTCCVAGLHGAWLCHSYCGSEGRVPLCLVQIKSYREHKGPVTDLSFDASAESLASSSSDGSIAVSVLFMQKAGELVSTPAAVHGCMSSSSNCRYTGCTRKQYRSTRTDKQYR